MVEEVKSKRPDNSDFKQQRLPAWQPLLTPKWVIGTFCVLAIIFLPLGIIITIASNSVVQLEQRYDNTCTHNSTCTVTFTVSKEMKQPVYLYYQLSNYYQNHRRYVKSRSDAQLRGDLAGSVGDCDPQTTGAGGLTLVPCGLIAGSYFNDTFSLDLTPSGGTKSNLVMDFSTIAWSSDRNDKFKSAPINVATQTKTTADGVTLPSVDDPHFIVWMRTAGLPTFKKLYGKIYKDLAVGDVITVNVGNYYPVSAFNGEKALVLSTTTWLGGKNPFLGWAYIVVGVICVLLAIMFALKNVISPRRLGDMRYFHWTTGEKVDE